MLRVTKNVLILQPKKFIEKLSLGGGIGRRVGLKNRWGNTRAGSIPALGTDFLDVIPCKSTIYRGFFFAG